MSLTQSSQARDLWPIQKIQDLLQRMRLSSRTRPTFPVANVSAEGRNCSTLSPLFKQLPEKALAAYANIQYSIIYFKKYLQYRSSLLVEIFSGRDIERRAACQDMWKTLFLFACLVLVGTNGALSSDSNYQQQLAVVHRSSAAYCTQLRIRSERYKCKETDRSKLSSFFRYHHQKSCPTLLRILAKACHQPADRNAVLCGKITSAIRSRGCERLVANSRRACQTHAVQCTGLRTALRTRHCYSLIFRRSSMCR